MPRCGGIFAQISEQMEEANRPGRQCRCAARRRQRSCERCVLRIEDGFHLPRVASAHKQRCGRVAVILHRYKVGIHGATLHAADLPAQHLVDELLKCKGLWALVATTHAGRRLQHDIQQVYHRTAVHAVATMTDHERDALDKALQLILGQLDREPEPT